MRLIASFEDERKAYTLHALLLESDIESSFTSVEDASTSSLRHQVWVVNEDDVDKANEICEAFDRSPEEYVHRRQQNLENAEEEPLIKGPIKITATSPLVMLRRRVPVTRWAIIICVILFLWNGYQKGILVKENPALLQYFGLTSLTMSMLYELPPVFEDIYRFFLAHPGLDVEETQSWPPAVQEELSQLNTVPYWKGFYEKIFPEPSSQASISAPTFAKIKQGELWRLFTPALMHGNFLHILFNMLWLWMLGKEMESKIGKIRYIAVMILIGIICNTAQYLISGPLFMGYSGIICGLGGFIWTRQKTAPWEGYTIPPGTLLFLFIFILGMLVLQTIALIVSRMHLGEFSVGRIGNTAHIVGVLCGLLFARIPLFYRLKS